MNKNNAIFLLFFHSIVVFSSLHAMEPFPGVPPFTLEKEKWIVTGNLHHSQVSFLDKNNQRFFLKYDNQDFLKYPSKISEFFYQYFARRLGVPCQQSWQWTLENAHTLDPDEKLSEWTRGPSTYVIKYEPDSIQSSFVLGGDGANLGFRWKEFDYKKEIKDPVETIDALDKQQTRAIKIIQDYEEEARELLNRKAEVLQAIKNAKERYEKEEDKDAKDRSKIILDTEILLACSQEEHQKYCDLPLLHTLQGEPVEGVQLSADGTSVNGVRSWLMKIPEHKKSFLTQLDESLDFDSESLIKIQVLNHILGMGDRTWHNLLYKYDTKSFIAIDNENIAKMDFPEWYKSRRFLDDKYKGIFMEKYPSRPAEDVVTKSDQDQKKMFKIYKDSLEQFLVEFQNPEAVIEVLNEKFPEYQNIGDFWKPLRKKLKAGYPKIRYMIEQINADLEDRFTPDEYPPYEAIEEQRKFQEQKAIALLAAEEIARQEIITQEEAKRVALQLQFETDRPITIARPEPVVRNMPPSGFKRVGNVGLGITAAVGLLLTIDSIKRKGLHPYLKDLGRYLSSLSRKLPKKDVWLRFLMRRSM